MREWCSDRTSNLSRRLTVAAVLAVMLTAVQPLGAATLTYPGAAPCNTTLQACIDAAIAGDVVEIATSTPIAESPLIGKSLTLRSAAGYEATLADGEYLNVTVSGGVSATVVVEHLRLVRGVVMVINAGTGAVTATVDHVTVDQSFTTNPTFGLSNYSTGTLSVTLSNSTADVPTPYSGGSVSAVHVYQQAAGTLTARILHNTFTVNGTGDYGVIHIGDISGVLHADVIGNSITGTDFNMGIWFYESGTGSMSGRVVNNLVVGQSDYSGSPAAISILAYEETSTVAVEVVNNTVVDGETGIVFSGPSGGSGAFSGRVVNNIVSGCDGSIFIDELYTASVPNSHNLIFGDSHSGFTPGPETWWVNPGFVGGSDFHLLPTSFAVNTGSNAAVPGDVTTDLDGMPRIFEGAVDRGAYELQEPRQVIVSAVPALSGLGASALALVVLLLGGLVLRRALSA